MKTAIQLLVAIVTAITFSQQAFAQSKSDIEAALKKPSVIRRYMNQMKVAMESCSGADLDKLIKKNDAVEKKLAKHHLILAVNGEWIAIKWKGVTLKEIEALTDLGCNEAPEPPELAPLVPIEPPSPPPDPSLPLPMPLLPEAEDDTEPLQSASVASEASDTKTSESEPPPEEPVAEELPPDAPELKALPDDPTMQPSKVVKKEEGSDLPYTAIMWTGVAVSAIGAGLTVYGGYSLHNAQSTVDNIDRESHTQMQAWDDRQQAKSTYDTGRILVILGPIVTALGIGAAIFGLSGDDTSVTVAPSDGGAHMSFTTTW